MSSLCVKRAPVSPLPLPSWRRSGALPDILLPGSDWPVRPWSADSPSVGVALSMRGRHRPMTHLGACRPGEGQAGDLRVMRATICRPSRWPPPARQIGGRFWPWESAGTRCLPGQCEADSGGGVGGAGAARWRDRAEVRRSRQPARFARCRTRSTLRDDHPRRDARHTGGRGPRGELAPARRTAGIQAMEALRAE